MEEVKKLPEHSSPERGRRPPMPSVKEKELQELFLFLQSRCASVGSERDLRGRDASPPGTHRKTYSTKELGDFFTFVASEMEYDISFYNMSPHGLAKRGSQSTKKLRPHSRTSNDFELAKRLRNSHNMRRRTEEDDITVLPKLNSKERIRDSSGDRNYAEQKERLRVVELIEKGSGHHSKENSEEARQKDQEDERKESYRRHSRNNSDKDERKEGSLRYSRNNSDKDEIRKDTIKEESKEERQSQAHHEDSKKEDEHDHRSQRRNSRDGEDKSPEAREERNEHGKSLSPSKKKLYRRSSSIHRRSISRSRSRSKSQKREGEDENMEKAQGDKATTSPSWVKTKRRVFKRSATFSATITGGKEKKQEHSSSRKTSKKGESSNDYLNSSAEVSSPTSMFSLPNSPQSRDKSPRKSSNMRTTSSAGSRAGVGSLSAKGASAGPSTTTRSFSAANVTTDSTSSPITVSLSSAPQRKSMNKLVRTNIDMDDISKKVKDSWSKPFLETPATKDLPRLASRITYTNTRSGNNINIVAPQDMSPRAVTNHMMTNLVCSLETRAIATKLKKYIDDGKANPTPDDSLWAEGMMRVVGFTSSTAQLLKTIHQSIIMSVASQLKIIMLSITNSFTKDVRTPDGWQVLVNITDACTEVTHIRKEVSIKTGADFFQFTWELKVVLSPNFSEITDIHVSAKDLEIAPEFNPELKEKLTEAIKGLGF